MTNEQFIKKCFNSKDIADHCVAIGHELTLLEKAVIVHWSNITMQDKLEVYHALLDTEQDMEVPDSIHHDAIPSLKEWLTWLVEYREAPACFDPEKVREDWHISFLEDFFILVPTPFKRGDIVCKPAVTIEDYYDAYDEESRKEKIFVLNKKLNRWTKEFFKRPPWERLPGRTIVTPFNWDGTDMNGEAVYQLAGEWSGKYYYGFYFDHMDVSYLDLEYYRGELEGKKRILKYLSLFLKGLLLIDDFVFAIDAIKYEEGVKMTRSMMENIEECIEWQKAKKEEKQCQA